MIVKYITWATCLFFASSLASYGQSFNKQSNFLNANSIWHFGEAAGLDFNTGSPVPIQAPGFYAMGGGISVSDPETGALLFYSDGSNCYNRNNQVMPNGDNLMTGMYASAGKQGVVAVPVIDTPGKYYLFLLESKICGGGGWIGGGFICHHLSYSIVDMSLDNGNGDVVAQQKTILLDSSLTGSLITIPDEGCGIWLLAHSTSDPDVVADPYFKAFHITEAGIDPVPVVSSIKSGITTPSGSYYPAPQAYLHTWMSVSPNRKMVALGAWNFDYGAGYPDGPAGPIFNELQPVDMTSPNPGVDMPIHVAGLLAYKFDPATGIVSDEIFVRNYGAAGSVCFSPDNTKLYANLQGPVNGGLKASDGSTITQYDVSQWDSTAIVSSKKDIFRTPGIQDLEVVDLKLYNDTIYFSKYNNPGYLGKITTPNGSGNAAGYKDSVIKLLPQTFAYSPFPNQVVYSHIKADTLFQSIDTLICTTFDNLTLQALHEGKELIWDDGSTDPQRTISGWGTYWVRYNNQCTIEVDTFVVDGAHVEPIINVDVFTLSTTQPYDSYQWLLEDDPIPGATEREYVVKENGTYTVIVNQGNCVATSAPYRVTNTGITPSESWKHLIKVYPNPANEWVSIQAPEPLQAVISSIEGKVLATYPIVHTPISLKQFPAGLYFLQLMDKEGSLIRTEKIIKQQ